MELKNQIKTGDLKIEDKCHRTKVIGQMQWNPGVSLVFKQFYILTVSIFGIFQ